MAKIERKTQKIFSGLNPSKLGVFGSAQALTPATSDDPDVIQSAAYEQGWTDATIGGDKRPPLEEFNGIKYVNDYQNAYLLQEGIAEYDAATEYHEKSLVKEVATGLIFSSKIDTNTGNALVDGVNWELMGSLKTASNIVIVNSPADLPTPSGGKIPLELKQYLFNDFVDIGANSLEAPAGGSAFINFVTLNAGIINNTVPLFTGSDFGSIVAEKGVFLTIGSSGYFDTDNAGQIFIFDSIFASGNLGTLKNDNFVAKFCNFFDYGTGFVSANRTDLVPRTQFGIVECFFGFSQNTATTIIDSSGDVFLVFIEASSSEIQSNETLFNFDESIKDFGGQIVVRGSTVLTNDGLKFNPNSLKQDYINAVFDGNIGLQDSTAVAKIRFDNNSAATTITVTGQNEPINNNDPYDLINLQRFLVQDICTFDNATDTINTAFNHGKVNDDRIFFHTYTGTLPAEIDGTTEYYIVNAAAASFQVSLTQGGLPVNFTDNGTGTNYMRGITGVSPSGEIIYIGLEDLNIAVGAWVSIINTQNNNDSVRGVVMKINLDGTIVEGQVGATITVDNTDPQSSQLADVAGNLEFPIVTGEGVAINIRNDDAARNLIAQEILVILKKV